MKKNEWYAKNGSTTGYSTRIVRPGNLITFKEGDCERVGRVLDEVKEDGCGKAYPEKTLRVLALGNTLTYAFIRHVPVDWITDCREVNNGIGEFLAVFMYPALLGEFSTPGKVVAASEYGMFTDLGIEHHFKVEITRKFLPSERLAAILDATK